MLMFRLGNGKTLSFLITSQDETQPLYNNFFYKATYLLKNPNQH